MNGIGQDVRFALRMLRKHPGFAGVAVLCLALGIGANAAIFSVVDAVLLRPLPYERPERLTRLYETMPAQGAEVRGSVSWPNYRDWVERTRSFEGLVAYTLVGRNLSHAEGPAERLRAVAATANLFEVLGVSPRVGRGFAPGEDAPGSAPVVVVSEGLWRRRFGEDPALVGRALTLNGQPHTVIGILPDSLRFPAGERETDVFIPFVAGGERTDNRGAYFLGVIGRVRAGVTLEAANAELREVARRLEQEFPADQSGRSAAALPLAETVVGRVRPALLVLQGAVLLVLLIACANVANLLLAQAASRRQEVAIRMALGASRVRLVRQLLVESLLLALAGALAGVLLALAGLEALETLVQHALPLTGGIPLQGRTVSFLLGVAVGSSVLFGLFPALRATQAELATDLAESGARGSPSRSHQRFLGGLVVGELALSLILLVGAGLLLRGFVTLLATEPGLDARGVLTARLSLPTGKYPPEQLARRLLTPLLERAQALPGVEAAALVSHVPIQSSGFSGEYAIVGRPTPEPGQEPYAEYRVSSPDLLRALGIPLLAGRGFTEREGSEGERGVLVNRALARRHFQEQDVVGQRLIVAGEPAIILGVMGDVRQGGLDREPLPEIHLPYNQPQTGGWFQEVSLVLKTRGEPMSVVPALRDAVRAVDSDLPLSELFTLEEVITRSVAGRRLNLVLLGTFALIALVLASAGLYGVLSYLVAQRSRELGIRVALGARPRDVVGLVMRQGTLLVAVGLGAGLAGALGLSRLVESLLYGVSARDPLTFTGLAVLLGGIALVATWLPARRASRVDPVIVMRGE
jgi:predicted permease